ncbi:MAG: hypothetical protein Q7S87_17980 [Agitococcus sp.]|nr:hypothetical protein [Agitococcus sp.]
MFRSVNPKNQVALIEAFVKTSGGTAAHTKVLELVAQLNGAANWNAIHRELALSTTRKAMSAKAKEFIEPLAYRWGTLDALRQLPPVRARQSNVSVMESLYHCLASVQENGVLGNPVGLMHERITLLKKSVDMLEQDISSAYGLRKMADISPDEVSKELVLTSSLYLVDSDREWLLETGETALLVPDELLGRLVAQGIVTGAAITYANGQKYGVPDAATDTGGMAWMWAHGFTVSSQFLMECEDTRDDAAAVMSLRILVPMDLAAMVDLFIAEEDAAQETGVLILSSDISLEEEGDWAKFDGLNDVALSQEALDLVKAHGMIIKGVSNYPNAMKYGVPDIAVGGMFRHLLQEEGLSISPGGVFSARDTRDDSAAYGVISVRLPRDVLKSINDLLA